MADTVTALELNQAALDVLAERRRQVRDEVWTARHDDKHQLGELAWAAAAYAEHSSRIAPSRRLPALWPWDRKWWKPTNRRRDLVKAGALILAEIECLDRAALAQPQPEERGPLPLDPSPQGEGGGA